MMIPIFDSLAHPTVNGTWLGRGSGNIFSALVDNLHTAGFCGACAVGLAGVDDYNHRSFSYECSKFENLVPIAGFRPARKSVETDLSALKDLGFVGIKIHPRFSKIDLKQEKDLLVEVLKVAGSKKLVVFYCTYQHTSLLQYPEFDYFLSLVSILKRAPETRVVLVHGGDVQLMRYAELVRFNDNLLLDLSLTMMKYNGSSIDLDIKFLLKFFDRRICIGSDHPEYAHRDVRARFEMLATGVSENKQRNVAYRNIIRFLDLDEATFV